MKSDPADLAFHPSGWFNLASGKRMTCMPVWDTRHNMAVRGSEVQRAWLAARGMSLPTAAEYRELHKRSKTHLPAVTYVDICTAHGWPTTDAYRNAHMKDREWCIAHDRMAETLLRAAGWDGASPVAGFGKQITVLGEIIGSGGWAPIQPLSRAHVGTDQDDYATNAYAVANGGTTEPTKEPPPMPPTNPTAPTPPAAGASVEAWKAWQRFLVAGGFRDDEARQLKVDGIPGARTRAATRGWQLSAAITCTGIDVSGWQPPGRLDDVAIARDHRFMIARATYGTRADLKFQQHVREGRAAGLKVGAYHFYRQTQPLAIQLGAFEAAMVAAGFGSGDLVPALDLETNELNADGTIRDGKPNPVLFNGGGRAFAEACAKRWGGCLVYISPGFWVDLGRPSWISSHHAWVADWRGYGAPTWPLGEWAIWQVSAKHRHAGFPIGDLDLNRARKLPLVG